jgi:hypothetical protein
LPPGMVVDSPLFINISLNFYYFFCLFGFGNVTGFSELTFNDY